ncbi:hypothetical protein [Streptomyces pseudogriseolus]
MALANAQANTAAHLCRTRPRAGPYDPHGTDPHDHGGPA